MREPKVPLRTVLENFINHVESLEAKKADNGEQEFQELKKLTEGLKTDPRFTCLEGEEECNRRKNRYKDILPYDRTRVVLRPFPGIPGSDYINANYIRGASGSRAYIASQGPLPHTVADFWRMVVECDVQVIVMASNETEGGKHKCECYWVENSGEEKQFGNVNVTFVKSRQVCPDFLVRTFKIKFTTEKNKTEERTICQFHYILWPDHGVPDTVRPLLDMVRLVRDCQASETLPVLVHCSAGCGRTGTICAIDYVWGLLRTGKMKENLDLFGLVKDMRRQRVAMVQTREQYILLHQAVKELFKDRLKLIDSHPYENVASDGKPKILREKESDYEDLFVTQEKEDKSTKTLTPTPSVSSTPSDSLNRKGYNVTPFNKEERDFLRRSSSTSSLENPHISPSNKASMIQNIPFTFSQSALLSGIDGTNTHNFLGQLPCVAPNFSEPELDSCTKRPPSGFSKMEKEAENIAQKMEAKQREQKLYSSLSALSQLGSASSSPSNTPFQTPMATPAVTPSSHSNIFPGLLMAPNPPPAPPPRSRTPSPIVSLRKVMQLQKRPGNQLEVPNSYLQRSPEQKRKSTEIVRRPSIQKLKELFEKSDASGPGPVRLSRSASSVTANSNLSIHGNNLFYCTGIRRKASLGSDENLPSRKHLDFLDTNNLQICPPPPPLKESKQCQKYDTSSTPSYPYPTTSLNAAKPPSSPHSSPRIKRRDLIAKGNKEECVNKVSVRKDERPALPIKKSKSFRYSRNEGTSSTRSSTLSPELSQKTTYFSLERGKDQGSSVNKVDLITKKLVEDFPSPREGFKLSVYQDKNIIGSVENKSFRSEPKPLIPPKKSIGERYKNIKPLPLHLQTLHPLQSVDSDTPDGMICSPSENSLGLYPQDIISDMIYAKVPTRKLSESRENLLRADSGSQPIIYDVPQTTKEYVNTRIMKSQLENSQSSKLVYVPVPSKRKAKDKESHDYANFDIGAKFEVPTVVRDKDNQKISLEEKNNSHDSEFKSPTSNLGQPSSPDYEPVDFGEKAITVDEVFETLNYELLGGKGKLMEMNVDNPEYSTKEFNLNRDLDSLAIQVYQDCQDYLLYGTNLSPVPSLMPKTKERLETPAKTNAIDGINKRLVESLTDLEEVKNKVAVPRQGLRNRERRDSYRQAVNPHSSSQYNPCLFDNYGNTLPRKGIHKYEKIWFDKDETDSDMKKVIAAKIETSHDYSTNLNQQMNINGKEDLFKDKLEELNNLVTNLEKKKDSILSDLSEEEMSSKDSSSTSSLLSKSEPIYANAFTTTFTKALENSSNTADRSTRMKLSQAPLGVHSVTPSYSTIATTTHPHKPKTSGSNNTYFKSKPSMPSNHAATLPARTNAPMDAPFKASHYPKEHLHSFHHPLVNESLSTTDAAFLTSRKLDEANHRAAHSRSTYKRLPSTYFKSSKKKDGTRSSAIVGDRAFVEGTVVKLRRPVVPAPLSAISSKESSRGCAPLAPPRIKRNSALEAPKIGTTLNFRPPPPRRCASDLDKVSISSLAAKKNMMEDPSTARSILSSNISPDISSYHHPPPPKPVRFAKTPLLSKSASTSMPSHEHSKDCSMNGNSEMFSFPPPPPACLSPISTLSPPTPIDASTTDTSDEEEGIFHKMPVFWSKLIGGNASSKQSPKDQSSRSQFFDGRTPPEGAEGTNSEDPVSRNDNHPPTFPKSKEEYDDPTLLSSPKPFIKAFGKLKLGSVAANFKTYLKGNDDSPAIHSRFHPPLQKSCSSGPAVGIFNQVVRDYKYPLSIPKKPMGPCEMPNNFSRASTSSPSELRPGRPKQQYL